MNVVGGDQDPALAARFAALPLALGLRGPAAGPWPTGCGPERAGAGPGSWRMFVAKAGGRDVGRLAVAYGGEVRDARGRPAARAGFLACVDDPLVARALLAHAREWLAPRVPAATSLLAPMSFDTWRPYRARLDAPSRAPFPGEPDDPPWHAALLDACDLSRVELYESRLVGDPARAIRRWSGAARRLHVRGYRTRRYRTRDRVPAAHARARTDGPASPPVARGRERPQGGTEDLSTTAAVVDVVWSLTHAAFALQPHFTRLGRDEFGALFAGAGADDAAELVILHDPRGDPVGFAYGFLDPADPRTACLKTVAVDPVRAPLGAGSALGTAMYRRFQRRGASSVRHCLMRADGPAVRYDRGVGIADGAYCLWSGGVGG